MNKDIKRLIDLTTIFNVIDKQDNKRVFGEYFPKGKLEQNINKQQANWEDLEKNWEDKWKSFGISWSKELQDYRFLYDSFKFFYLSFEQLKYNKILCINKSRTNKKEAPHLNELTGVSLYGMYIYGKKCIDLLSKLKLIKKGGDDFYGKFSETRDKLIEHNYNPRDIKSKENIKLQIEPSILSLINTDTKLEISLHTENEEEAYCAYVNYYKDYFELEKRITKIIENFNRK